MVKVKDIQFDDWQREILDYDGDILLNKGRRIGGTEIFSVKAVLEMVKRPGIKIVMVSLTEDQAQLIIDVAHNYALLKYPKLIGKGKLKPTLNKLYFTNGSSMIVRPLGTTGNAIRSFDGDILGIDEAPWQDKKIWRAARPIIATNNGKIWMWGSPGAKEGYFWEQFSRYQEGKQTRFKVWNKNSEEVLFNRPISSSWTQEQHDGVIRILKEEKESMTKLEYANEFLAQFVDDINQFFPDPLIMQHQCLERSTVVSPLRNSSFFLGVDVAKGTGLDETAIQVLEKIDGVYYHRESITSKYMKSADTVEKILELDRMYNFQNIYVDDGGVGVAVFDPLLNHEQTKRKVVAINNASRSLDYDGRKRKLLKEDLYFNFKNMLEKGQVKLLTDPDVYSSLKSIMLETENAQIRIYGRYSHITEALIRAAWSNHSTRLNLWCR